MPESSCTQPSFSLDFFCLSLLFICLLISTDMLWNQSFSCNGHALVLLIIPPPEVIQLAVIYRTVDWFTLTSCFFFLSVSCSPPSKLTCLFVCALPWFIHLSPVSLTAITPQTIMLSFQIATKTAFSIFSPPFGRLLILFPGCHPDPISIWNDRRVKKAWMQRDHVQVLFSLPPPTSLNISHLFLTHLSCAFWVWLNTPLQPAVPLSPCCRVALRSMVTLAQFELLWCQNYCCHGNEYLTYFDSSVCIQFAASLSRSVLNLTSANLLWCHTCVYGGNMRTQMQTLAELVQ